MQAYPTDLMNIMVIPIITKTVTMRKILSMTFILPFLVLSSCGGGGDKGAENAQEITQTEDSITEVVIDTIPPSQIAEE